MEAEKHYFRDLKDALPDSSNEEVTRPTLLNRGGSFSTRNFNNLAFNFCFHAVHDLATQHILNLEERNKELKARIAKKEAEIHDELNRQRYLNHVLILYIGDCVVPGVIQ